MNRLSVAPQFVNEVMGGRSEHRTRPLRTAEQPGRSSKAGLQGLCLGAVGPCLNSEVLPEAAFCARRTELLQRSLRPPKSRCTGSWVRTSRQSMGFALAQRPLHI